MRSKIIIVGAGASGLFCAHLLARAGFNPLVLESEVKAGRKLAISGGGHANFSNLEMSPAHFFSEPGFCDIALKAFPPENFLAFLRESGFSWRKKSRGRLFLTERAEKFAYWLEKDARENGAAFLYENKVIKLEVAKTPEHSLLITTEKKAFPAGIVILAQGSGAGGRIAGEGSEHFLAKQIGHKIVPFSPALTPMFYAAGCLCKSLFSSLAGISVTAKVGLKNSIVAKTWEDGFLFTHNGISGPAILCASLYWQKGNQLEVDFLPKIAFENILDEYPKSTPFFSLRKFLPERLAQALLDPEIALKKNAQLSRLARKNIAAQVHNFVFKDLHKGKLTQAEVCSGGVDCREIDKTAMRSLINPDVYIIGEGMNVTGELGGYNLHWAWASAAACAQSILQRKVKGEII